MLINRGIPTHLLSFLHVSIPCQGISVYPIHSVTELSFKIQSSVKVTIAQAKTSPYNLLTSNFI